MFDFDNCWSVKCRSCPKYFCAWCLTYTTSDAEEGHDHVRACPENPHPGAVYGDMDYWERIHRPMKRDNRLLWQYDVLRSSATGAIVAAYNGVRLGGI